MPVRIRGGLAPTLHYGSDDYESDNSECDNSECDLKAGHPLTYPYNFVANSAGVVVSPPFRLPRLKRQEREPRRFWS